MAVTSSHLLATGSYLCNRNHEYSQLASRYIMMTNLDSVETGGPVIAPYTVEDALYVSQLVCGPPAVHAGDWLPGVTARTESLSGLETHRPVIAAHTVEHPLHGGHTAGRASRGHGGHRLPLTNPAVQPLH